MSHISLPCTRPRGAGPASSAGIAERAGSINSALPAGVLRAPAEPELAIDSALPAGVLRAPAEPELAIDSALPAGVLRAPAEPGLAIAIGFLPLSLPASHTSSADAMPKSSSIT